MTMDPNSERDSAGRRASDNGEQDPPPPPQAPVEFLSLGRESEAEDSRPFDLEPERVAAVQEALAAGSREALLETLDGLHAADTADLLEQLPSKDRKKLISAIGSDLQGEVLTELEPAARDAVLNEVEPAVLAEAVRGLETDDVVYVVGDLDPASQAEALAGLEPGELAAVRQSLGYPEYSAGRLMQRELVWAPPFLGVGDLLEKLRAEQDELPEQFYEVIVVDPTFKPIGTAPLSRVLAASQDVSLGEIMKEDFTLLTATQPQEEVAYAFNQYHLVSAPVVDEDGRLVGVITIDDAMQALDEEAEEDLLRLGGVGEEELADKVTTIVMRRFPWLAVNLVTAILASLVIGVFDAALEQVVALAILMPIVASMGGNAGTQTLTVAVRALATRNLTSTNALRIVGRETAVGLVNGLAFALVIGVVGYIWFGDAQLGLVLAAAMVINLLAAGLAGILIPIALDRLGADPALASGAFVTTVTDIVGFFAFLGLAVLVLL
ncbi:MAG: magnesium transporter [Pseudomonadota bacterium]